MHLCMYAIHAQCIEKETAGDKVDYTIFFEAEEVAHLKP